MGWGPSFLATRRTRDDPKHAVTVLKKALGLLRAHSLAFAPRVRFFGEAPPPFPPLPKPAANRFILPQRRRFGSINFPILA